MGAVEPGEGADREGEIGRVAQIVVVLLPSLGDDNIVHSLGQDETLEAEGVSQRR